MSGPVNIPAPLYDSSTQEALNYDIEADLDDDKILKDHQERNNDNSDVYARQALIRAQQQLADSQAQVSELTSTTQTLQQTQEYLRGQVDSLSNASRASQEQAQQEAQLAQYSLTPQEQAAFGDSMPAVEKMISKALYLQKQDLTAQFDAQLAQRTSAAVQPLAEEITNLKQGTELNEQRAAATFEASLAAQMQARNTTLNNVLQDPDFAEKVRQRVPGAGGKTYFDVLKENSQSQNLSGMMEIIDHCMPTEPQQSIGQVPPSGGSQPAGNGTPADKAKMAKQTELVAKLEQMEHANAIGDYSKFGGSRQKFMDARNKVLNEIEQNSQ